jgi:hypothetical protein
MYLLSGEQRPIADADRSPNFAMRGIKPLQHFDFNVRNVDAWNSLRKRVTADSDCAQRGKLFERKIHYPNSNSELQYPEGLQSPKPRDDFPGVI